MMTEISVKVQKHHLQRCQGNYRSRIPIDVECRSVVAVLSLSMSRPGALKDPDQEAGRIDKLLGGILAPGNLTRLWKITMFHLLIHETKCSIL